MNFKTFSSLLFFFFLFFFGKKGGRTLLPPLLLHFHPHSLSLSLSPSSPSLLSAGAHAGSLSTTDHLKPPPHRLHSRSTPLGAKLARELPSPSLGHDSPSSLFGLLPCPPPNSRRHHRPEVTDRSSLSRYTPFLFPFSRSPFFSSWNLTLAPGHFLALTLGFSRTLVGTSPSPPSRHFVGSPSTTLW